MNTEAAKGGAVILEKVQNVIAEFHTQEEISGICISTAGVVDTNRGIIPYIHDIPVKDPPIFPDQTVFDRRSSYIYTNIFFHIDLCLSFIIIDDVVDTNRGIITYSAPLIPDYAGTEYKKILENRFRIPCEVENDVNCAGLAEYYSGMPCPKTSVISSIARTHSASPFFAASKKKTMSIAPDSRNIIQAQRLAATFPSCSQ